MDYSRRDFLKATTAAGLGGLFTGGCAVPEPKPLTGKPNILMILIDDMGWMDLGCYGSDLYQTPNIDKFAKQGTRFTQAYAAAHICSPTRASILTGKYPARLQLTDWVPGYGDKGHMLMLPPWKRALEQEEVTLGEHFKKAGYRTAWFGKWHVGGGGAQNNGFDAGHQDWTYNKQQSDDDPKGIYTLNKEAQTFIEESGSDPWFVCLSHYSVHTPVRCSPGMPAKYERLVTDDSIQKDVQYAGMVEDLDDSVGKMLKWIDKKDLAKSTLVVFFSDNGGLDKGDDKGPTNNDPLRDGKASLYEGGTRVPMMVRWPDRVPAGKECDDMVCSIDFLPTLLEITGAGKPAKDIDGISLAKNWLEGIPVERDTLYWHYPHYHRCKPCGSILKGDYKLIEFFEDGRLELYNIKKDLGETTNLAEKEPKKTKELHDALKKWRKEVGAQMMTKNPDYKPGPEKKKKKK